MVYSMDALFGLPRKKISGISYREALHRNIFFANQTSVDETKSMSDNIFFSFQGNVWYMCLFYLIPLSCHCSSSILHNYVCL